LDRKTPSGFSARVSAAVVAAGTTVTRQPCWTNSRKDVALHPEVERDDMMIGALGSLAVRVGNRGGTREVESVHRRRGRERGADRITGLLAEREHPRIAPLERMWRVSCRVSTSETSGIFAPESQSISVPVARQFEGVAESSRTTTPEDGAGGRIRRLRD